MVCRVHLAETSLDFRKNILKNYNKNRTLYIILMLKWKPDRKEGGVISHFFSPSKGRKERKVKKSCGFTFLCTRCKGTL